MDMRQTIAERLQSLEIQVFEFQDDSHLHVGHAGNTGGGHYSVLLVSNAFQNHSRLARQRMVKNLLHDLFADGMIHALSIKAQTPEEYFH
ncbi:BolA family protein [Neisseria animalis]|uniref:BolA family transcriptional regulator n=1 Tax=Neisseria animalis TaxID=492 RepID=A0A5P3MRG6_NEIAN|nr:BolA family protein [Neisseria animalis]QEY24174.1 BolA family transcriptional regulator [Neisseria animalis]ROW32218.1 BolA family transcriptional regulator [Neisseria animalis]VEE06441.1 BolA/YrbA family protein [Neisseria animalis]